MNRIQLMNEIRIWLKEHARSNDKFFFDFTIEIQMVDKDSNKIDLSKHTYTKTGFIDGQNTYKSISIFDEKVKGVEDEKSNIQE